VQVVELWYEDIELYRLNPARPAPFLLKLATAMKQPAEERSTFGLLNKGGQTTSIRSQPQSSRDGTPSDLREAAGTS